ncbi:MAG TPA: alpha-glucosidase [Anaerolineales bacterium]|nr:alpha-glucosidase [Anaerolineales bacterium]
MSALPWYHQTSIYQIYPRSFHDSNRDGIGDLQGIIQRLDYLRELGFESIWCSPFFTSPQADFGYDVSSYTEIAPEYGTLSDALQLIEETHRRGMKIVFDLVMNHTSKEHPWFKESLSSRDNPRADWYLWRDKPNNWQSMTGGSGWQYAKERDQYYWASFLPFQPDLNYRNPEVKKTMFDIVRFWLGKGVDGFRLDIFNVLYKDAEFRNNPFTFELIPTESNPSGFFQKAQYTLNQPESYEFAKELRRVCDEFGERLLLGEVSGSRAVLRKFLGDKENDGLTLAFDFGMMDFKFNARYFHDLIADIEVHFPDPFMPVYVFSNHDRARSLSRLGKDVRRAKLLHLLQLTVRGVPCLYYGEEIGMTNLKLPFATALDPVPHKFQSIPRFVFDMLGLTINRDEVRTPMQWNGEANAGFSAGGRTWLPVHPDHGLINVEMESKQQSSLLNTIRAIMKIRNEHEALRHSPLEFMAGLPQDVLGYRRKSLAEEMIVVLNFSGSEKLVPFRAGNCIFKLSQQDKLKSGEIDLSAYGGMILTA